jgi:outer membrane protein OmpA-like peptidoglycan-associated protein
MAKATWRIFALSALMGGLAPMASAQYVVGGDGRSSVEVNWSVLENLGQDPNLAAMLRTENRPATQAALKMPGQQQRAQPQFRPFQQAVAKPAAAVPAAPLKPKAQPVAVNVEKPALAELIQATQKPVEIKPPAEPKVAEAKPAPVQIPTPAPVAKPAVPPKPQIAEVPVVKPEPAKPAGPQISLPEMPAPKPAAPAAVVKAEVPPAPIAPVAPVIKAEVPPAPVVAAPPAPAPMPLAVLTPPPAAPAPIVPQVAAVTGPAVALKGDTLSMRYAGEDFKLPDSARAELTALAKRMEKSESLSLQLLSYASGDEASASAARRLSLSRAIEVRKFLLDQGVRSTRIEMRALGNKTDGGSPDRVDAVLVGH